MAEVAGRWEHIRKVLNRRGPFVDYGDDFVPDSAESPTHFSYLRALEESGDKNCKILVIGAGGLGCELLKNLALSGFRDIHVVDMDTIDLSNLNRQFLFRESDIGKPKAEVAARFVNERVPGTNITAHYAKLQDMDDDFYRQFNLVIAGLDSIVARRWMNTTLLNMVMTDDAGDINPDTIIPFIDGGTEGWKGQARVILPRVTACFECTIELFPPKTAYPMCTLANTPRVPEHCIEYAKIVQWLRDWPFGKDVKPDMDDPLHLKWMYEHSLKRAEEFGIQGVTMSKTKGVVKNIIPAIASTNAIVSAACTNEAFKYVTNCSGYLNNYMFYSGLEGIYTYTFEYFPKESCLACGIPSRPMTLDPEQHVGDFLEELKDHPDLQMSNPSVRCGMRNTTIYMAAPKLLERKTRPNLEKPLKEFIRNGDVLDITDPALPGVAVTIPVTFSKAPIEAPTIE